MNIEILVLEHRIQTLLHKLFVLSCASKSNKIKNEPKAYSSFHAITFECRNPNPNYRSPCEYTFYTTSHESDIILKQAYKIHCQCKKCYEQYTKTLVLHVTNGSVV